jgi:DNA-directed RNA polymerase specialized sigma24 family protein
VAVLKTMSYGVRVHDLPRPSGLANLQEPCVTHRSLPSQEPPDDLDRGYDADQDQSVSDRALAQTDLDLSSAERDETEWERSRRLAVDRRLIEILARENFEGERFAQLYSKLAHKLTGYAWPILVKWLSTGQIFRECERYRKPVNQFAIAYGWTDDDRLQIATDTIIDAVEFFQDYGLRRGKWDWQRGASLRTYFVGACVCRFPRVHERWWKEQLVTQSVLLATQNSKEPHVDHPLNLVADPQADPCTLAVVRDEAHHAIRQMADLQLRQVVLLRAKGYTQAEAAHEVGLTEKAAERRLHRYREKYATKRLPVLPTQITGEQDRL